MTTEWQNVIAKLAGKWKMDLVKTLTNVPVIPEFAPGKNRFVSTRPDHTNVFDPEIPDPMQTDTEILISPFTLMANPQFAGISR